MQHIIWQRSISILFLFLANHYYARAIFLGLACARDEQHRMTALSPWYFFKKGFTPSARLFGITLIPWFLCGTTLVHYEWLELLLIDSVPFEDLWEYSPPYHFFASIGITAYSAALITILTPRLEKAFVVTAIGIIVGYLAYFSIFAMLRQFGFLGTKYLVHAICCFSGILGFSFIWLFVRFTLNRKWFRIYA